MARSKSNSKGPETRSRSKAKKGTKKNVVQAEGRKKGTTALSIYTTALLPVLLSAPSAWLTT